jgi:DNA (cytosine-5)-methyltransferase 1
MSVASARAGCDLRLSVEWDPVACRTLEVNAPYHGGEVLQADISTLDGITLRMRAGIALHDPLLIVGGPPCQAFSKAAFWSEDGDDAAYRRAKARGESIARPGIHAAKPDSRRTLVADFLRLVVEADADGFVFENVASITAPRNREILDGLIAGGEAAGYQIEFVRANAADFGAAQRRDRVFVLGAKSAKPKAPTPTHTSEPELFHDRVPAVTVRDVIAPYSGDEYFEPEEIVRGRWAEHLRTVPAGGNYKAHTAWGGHPNPSFVTETRYWNFLLKLSPDRPSWTIPASPGPWTGPFHWTSRRLRTPELAALQGFPHGYRFVGSRRERVRQIGNAAPSHLVEPMVKAVLESIEAPRARKRGRRIECVV